MKNWKKSRLYRVGSALMAAAMVFTCVPQTGFPAYAEELESTEMAEKDDTQPGGMEDGDTSTMTPAPSDKEGDSGKDGETEGQTKPENKEEKPKEGDGTPVEDSEDKEKEESGDTEEDEDIGDGENTREDEDIEEKTETPEEGLGEKNEPVKKLPLKAKSVYQVSDNDLPQDDGQEVFYDLELKGVYQFGDAPTAQSSKVQRAARIDESALEAKICQGISERKEEIDISEFNLEASESQLTYIASIVSGVINEHPEFYYIEKSKEGWISVSSLNKVYKTLKITYEAAGKYDDAAFENAVQDALAAVNEDMSDLQKAIILHDYLAVNCEYDKENLDNGSVPNVSHSAYGPLVKQIAVCDGYSLAYKYLLNKLGITCYMVTSEEMGHAWNMIVLDGKYYQVDVTWDDPTWDLIGRAGHKYMFCSDAAFVGHEKWAVTEGSTVVGYQAIDTKYDSAFWKSSSAPLIVVGNDCYYVSYNADKHQGEIVKGTLDKVDGAGEAICDIGTWYVWGSTDQVWTDAYSGLFMVNDRLYYNDTGHICSVDLNGTDKKEEYTANTETDGYIYGSALRQGKVLYSLHQTPEYTQRENVLTADISFGGGSEVDPPESEDSGTVGSISWSVSEDGLLTITGSGDSVGGSNWLPDAAREKTTAIKVTVSGMSSTAHMFEGFAKLKSVDLSGFNTSGVTDMTSMFSGCESLTELNLSGFDMSKVTNADGMLASCEALSVIQTPKNCNVSVALPAETGMKWIDNNTTYTELPKGQSSSITLTKEADAGDPAEYEITPPDKKIYLTSEKTLDLTGGAILDKSTQATKSPIKTEMVTGSLPGEEGVSSIAVTYDGKPLSFDVLTVKAPTDLSMTLGQKLSDITLPSSAYGTWQWKNGEQKPSAAGSYPASLQFTAKDSEKFGVRNDIETQITVKDQVAIAYGIKSPEKNVYLTGETLDLKGAQIIEKSTGNKVKDIEASDLSGQALALSKVGVSTFSVTHSGEKLTFDVLVVEAPTGLTMELGQSLADVTLPTSSFGTWQWKDSTEKPGAEGKREYKLTFTPSDTSKFTARTDIPVDVEVTKKKAVITGVTVSDTTYNGKAFSYTGTPVLRTAAGAVISGNVNLKTFYKGTCADGTDYDSTSAPKNAGSYQLLFSLEGADAGQYTLTGTTSYQFKIIRKALNIVVNPRTINEKDGVVPTPTYRAIGLLDGDAMVTEPQFSYNPTLPDPLKAGRYSVVPRDADAGPNYEISYTNGTLEVTGDEPAEDTRELFTVEFDTIQVKDKTYNGEKHSISGSPSWNKMELPLTCVCQVTGTTKEGEKYDESRSVSLSFNNVAKEFASAYAEIAPVKCGSYTFEVTVLVDDTKYNYPGNGFRQSFYVLPLKDNEMKLLGVTGITGKTYDGTPVDFSKQILSAKVQTNQGADIEGAVLEFGIKGTTAGSEAKDYDVTISPSNPTVGMPDKAGAYTLWVRLAGTKNYAEKVWEFDFEIKRKAITVTVENKEIPVHADDSLLGGYTYVITDAEGKVLSNDDFLKPTIVPLETVDPTKPGEYALAASGDIAGPSYDVTFVNGKLFLQAQLWGVREPKLTQNTNIPNGLSLEVIAGSYLPKKVTIYLDEDKLLTDTADVKWDTQKPYSGSYSAKNTAAQTFQMKGTVVLPDLVYVEDSHKDWLTVIVDVSVREAYEGQAMKPYADVQTGTVGAGTVVSLFTDEPAAGAQIYYTVAADSPSLSGKLYTEPIAIKCTMTIRAITRVSGKKDSEELRLVYYFDQNYHPGDEDPDDPDDPDNSKVPDEDVPKDENGKPLPIPEGLWVTDITGYTYTGKAIKPAVRVYDHKKRLEEKKDYTISYKNNVNAADKNSAKAPTITIKGRGNYEGTLTKTFTIAPKNINDPDVKADDLTVACNNKPQTPAPTVTWNGRKLKNKKEYSFEAAPQTAVGSYRVVLSGVGNYTGEREISFTISNATPAAKLSVSKLPACTYTGEAIILNPEPVVKSGKEVLKNGTDYKLSYEDNIEVGTASLLVTGMGRFAGVKRVNFQIKEAAVLNKAKAELRFAAPTVYTGKEITASDYHVTVQATVNGVKQERTLVKDTDYTVTYQNNVKAGKATVVFEGIGAYRGTLKKTFTISQYELDLDRSKLLKIQTDETHPYMKGGSTPKPRITFDGKKLQEGTDYTLSYKNNKAVGSPAVMTIKGKGSFKGSVSRGFHVTVQDIAETSVEPADKVFQLKANIYKTTIRVYDTNGKLLSAGKDYDKNVVYTYVNDTSLVNGTVKKANDEVAGTDIIPAGTKIKVTLNAVGANYQGTAVGEYAIVQSDISKAKITVPTQIYTGKAIEPQEKDITVILNGMAVPPEGYKITGYSNNVNKGTAKLTIRGQGNNYGGTKTVSFKIKSKSLLSQIFGS